MQWFGKALGAALGVAVAGPWGAVIGAALGHQFDQGLHGGAGGTSADARQLFFATSFQVMGHVAKVDGRVSEEEIRMARRIMHAMNLQPDQVRQAINHFTEGKRADYPLRQRLADLAAHIGMQRELSRAFVELQLQAVIGAGDVGESKRKLLWQIARAFNINRVELARMEAALRNRRGDSSVPNRMPGIESAYDTLGVNGQATEKEIKTAYRRLMNQHHPDKLVARGLPESMAAVAEQKTQEIRAAYDKVKAERGFR